MTKSQFVAAFNQAQAAKAAAQPGNNSGRPGVGPPPSGPGFGPQPEKGDPQVEAWVKTLTDKMNDPHDAIRESARAGLMAVGGPALPALRQLAAGNDAKAFAARRLVQQIEQNAGGPGRPPGFGGPPGDPRFGPMPPGGTPGRPAAGDPMAPGRPGAGREPAPAAPAPLSRVLGELNLTEPQRGEIAKVVEGYTTRMREVLEKSPPMLLERAEFRDTVAKMAEGATADLMRVLTPEQRRRLEQLVPAGRPLFPTPFGPEAGGATPRRPGPVTPDQPRSQRPNP
jgi:hypothetical protein